MGKLLCALAYLLLAPFIGGLMAGFDRRITARMQGRQGPPLLQPFYDVLKLFAKEPLVVNHIQNLLIGAYLIFTAFTGLLFFYGGDMLLIFFAMTLAEMFLVMCASSANSAYSSMGSERELLQMMAYEPMVLITAIGFYLASGSFAVSDIIQSSRSPILYAPGIFFGFAFILTIKLRKSPFDLSTSHHAHQEMVKGLTVEMSGRMLGITEIAHWYETVMLMGVIALFIINASWISWIIALVVCSVVYFLIILADNTFARVKWNVLLKSSWVVALVAGMLNLMILTYLR